MGLPKAHHIVVYMLAQLPDKYEEIQLKLQESEVCAAAWLDEFTVAEIVKSDEYGKTRKVSQRYFRLVSKFLEETHYFFNINCYFC